MSDRDIQIIIQAIDKTGSAIASIDKNLSWLGGSITKVAVQVSAMSTSIQAAWRVIQKGFELAEMGARAQQAEESFRQVAATAGESADKILEAMNRAANGTVDDSDLMQKAVKGITQGLKGDDLVKLMETARVAARATGEDVGATFDKIVDAVANKTPRALKDMGLVSKEQMTLFDREVRAGVEAVSLLDIVLANAVVRQAQFGMIAENNVEKFQRIKAELGNLKETIGGWLMTALEKIYGGFLWVAAGAMNAIAYIIKFDTSLRKIAAWVEEKTGFKESAAKQREMIADAEENIKALQESAITATGKAWETWTNRNPAAAVAAGTKKSLPDAQKALDELTNRMREAIEKSKIKPGKTAKVETTGRSPLQEDSPIYDTEKGIRAYAEYERSLTDIRATELEKRYIKVEEWATREYELLTKAYQNNLLNEKEYSDKLLEIQTEAQNQKAQIVSDTDNAIVQQTTNTWDSLMGHMRDYAKGQADTWGGYLDATSSKFMQFGDIVKDVLNEIYQYLLKNLALKSSIGGLLSNLFGGGGGMAGGGGGGAGAYFAQGNAFNQGNIIPFDQGGVFYRPTLFKMANGLGLMGEAGPEAVMPLTRTAGGKLGVIAQGGGGVNVVINLDNQSSAPVKAEQGGVAFDGESYVVNVVLKNIDGYGALRHAIAGVR